MNLILRRTHFGEDGIFGIIHSETGTFECLSLEHSYLKSKKFKPKIPPGKYKCVRGEHRLESMTDNFTTFEVMNVPGCTGILIHRGNKNEDSSGCILIATSWGNRSDGGKMICDSKRAFDTFMELQKDVNEFTLTVEAV